MQRLCSGEYGEFQKENGTQGLEGESDTISPINTTAVSLPSAAAPPLHWNFIPFTTHLH
jgi:hypothetical protein